MPFMQFVLLNIPTYVLCVIMVGGSAVLSVASLIIMRRIVPHHRLKQHNDVTGSVFATLGVLYAVLLAFVVVVVWQDFDRANMNVQREANYLTDLYRNSVAFSPDLRREVKDLVKEYITNLLNEEWKMMERGRLSDRLTSTVDKMWQLYSSYVPKNNTEQAFFEESVRELNDLGEARRTRLMDANTGVHPMLWIVLLAGGVVTMTFISFFGAESINTQMVMALLLAALVGLILFTIAAMDYPFTGAVSISQDSFRYLLTCLK